MRCRKVRSLLSAACCDELDVRRQAAVRDHLASCSSCRKEASYYTVVNQTIGQMPSKSLAQDFNARLLDRVARERFQQTRTRAYLPHAVPRLSWHLLAPVAVTAALALVAVSSFYRSHPTAPDAAPVAQMPAPMDDRYLTIQPVANRNITSDISTDWSLRNQLARTERLDRVSRALTNQNGFGMAQLAGATTYSGAIYPATMQYYLVPRSVYKVYRITGGSGGREDAQAY